MAEPPSYDEEPPEPPSFDLLKPATLYVAQRFIHPSDPQAPPLYELSHSVGFLRGTDRKVVLDRLDYSVRARSGTVSTRKRTLYDLTHRTPIEAPAYAFQGEARSRAAMGSLGMEMCRPKKEKKEGRGFSLSGMMRRSGYRVVRARWRDWRLVAEGTLFTAVPPHGKGEGGVTWEWSDGDDMLVAREVMKDGLMSLVVTAEMTQEMRDALVAAWMMRIWWGLSLQTPG